MRAARLSLYLSPCRSVARAIAATLIVALTYSPSPGQDLPSARACLEAAVPLSYAKFAKLPVPGASPERARQAIPVCEAARKADPDNVEIIAALARAYTSAGNHDRARTLHMAAAANGHAGSQFWLAWMHFEGKGVAKDVSESARFAKLAADQGYGPGLNTLGWLHHKGLGVARDLERAAALYRRAIATGFSDHPRRNLALLYHDKTFARSRKGIFEVPHIKHSEWIFLYEAIGLIGRLEGLSLARFHVRDYWIVDKSTRCLGHFNWAAFRSNFLSALSKRKRGACSALLVGYNEAEFNLKAAAVTAWAISRAPSVGEKAYCSAQVMLEERDDQLGRESESDALRTADALGCSASSAIADVIRGMIIANEVYFEAARSKQTNSP